MTTTLSEALERDDMSFDSQVVLITLADLADSSGMRADLLLAGAKPHAVFGQPSANLGALREELGVGPLEVETGFALLARQQFGGDGGLQLGVEIEREEVIGDGALLQQHAAEP